jgi:hypothetical protein
MRQLVAALVVASIACLLLAAGALADPTGSKNSFTGMASCTNGLSYPFVVNNSNGQGSGAQKNNTAEWAPAHFIGSNLVFHPAAFDLTFTFTPADGSPPQSFMNTDVRKNGKVVVMCTLSGSQTDPQGDTFSISGTVGGWTS